jgi:hypothetical protein
MNNKLNWGVPDWRDAKAYPDPVTTSVEQWRWEFLRRRQDYREDWKLHHLDGSEDGEPPLLPLPDGRYHISASIDKYGTKCLLDPASSAPDIYFLGDGLFALVKDAGGVTLNNAKRIIEEYDECRLVVFDISKPIEGQLDGVRQELLEAQQEAVDRKIQKGRKHHKLWPLYLRILDARNAKTKLKVIGQELMKCDPDNTNEDAKEWAHKRLKRAQKVAFNFPI